MLHKSDCEVHNAPAFPKGHCGCGADIIDEAKGFTAGLIIDYLDDYEGGKMHRDEFVKGLTEDFLVLRGNHFRIAIT